MNADIVIVLDDSEDEQPSTDSGNVTSNVVSQDIGGAVAGGAAKLEKARPPKTDMSASATSSASACAGSPASKRPAGTKSGAGSMMDRWLRKDSGGVAASSSSDSRVHAPQAVSVASSAVMDLTDDDGSKSAPAQSSGDVDASRSATAKVAPSSSTSLAAFSSKAGAAASSSRFPSNPDYRSVDSPIWSFDPVKHACWIAQPPLAAVSEAAAATSSSSSSAASTASVSSSAPAPYLHLARAFSAIEPVTGRIRISGMLINTFRALIALAPSEVHPALLLMTNSLGSAHEGLSMSIGGSTVAAAVSQATGVRREALSKMYTELGDMGDVAEKCARNQRTLLPPPPLTISGVLSSLLQIAQESGPGCAARKQGILLRLLQSCRGSETRYIVRTMVLNLRIGVNITTALQCLARAVALNEALGSPTVAGCNSSLASASSSAVSSSSSSPAGGRKRKVGGATGKRPTPPSFSSSAALDAFYTADIPLTILSAMDRAAEAAKSCFSQCPDLELLVASLLSGGVAKMTLSCTISPGVPVRPMLAKISSGVDELLTKFAGRLWTAEWKYDGQRSQVHLFPSSTAQQQYQPNETLSAASATDVSSTICGSSASTERIFSRHMDDVTARWPDVAQMAREAFKPQMALDESAGESVAAGTTISAASDSSNPLVVAAAGGSFILDAELVAVEVTPPASNSTASSSSSSTTADASSSSSPPSDVQPSVRLLPFQTLSTRKRTDVGSAEEVDVKVAVFAFDLLYINGRPLTSLPLLHRRALLRRHFTAIPGRFHFATGIDVLSPSAPAIAAATADAANVTAEASSALSAAALDIPATAAASTSSAITGDVDTVRESVTAFLMSALDGSCEGIICKLLLAGDPSAPQDLLAGSQATAAGGGKTTPAIVPFSDDAALAAQAMRLLQQDAVASSEEEEDNEAIELFDEDDDAARSPIRKKARPASSSSKGKSPSKASSSSSNAEPAPADSLGLVATYQPSVRSNSWLKLKRDYVSSLADTIDLVPIGAWWGNGRKAGWFSPFLLACYNPDTEEWQSVCR